MTIAAANGLESIQASGIVGMMPYQHDGRADDQLLVLQMKKRGVIKEAIFSFFIELKENESQVVLGGYNLDKFAEAGEDM